MKKKERNAKVIAYFNNKGGVGKTTLAVNHACWKAHDPNNRVLIIDFDCQCNTSANFLGFAREELTGTPKTTTIANIPGFKNKGIKKLAPTDLITKAPNFNMYAIKGNSDIDTLWESDSAVSGKLDIVMKCVDELRPLFDYIIIDLGPRKTKSTLAALCAADYVILPMTIDPMAESGIDDFFTEMLPVCRQYNPAITPLGIVLTRYKMMPTTIANYSYIIPPILFKYDIDEFSSKIRESNGFGNLLSVPTQKKAGVNRAMNVLDKYIRQNYRQSYDDFEAFMAEVDKKINKIEKA